MAVDFVAVFVVVVKFAVVVALVEPTVEYFVQLVVVVAADLLAVGQSQFFVCFVGLAPHYFVVERNFAVVEPFVQVPVVVALAELVSVAVFVVGVKFAVVVALVEQTVEYFVQLVAVTVEFVQAEFAADLFVVYLFQVLEYFVGHALLDFVIVLVVEVELFVDYFVQLEAVSEQFVQVVPVVVELAEPVAVAVEFVAVFVVGVKFAVVVVVGQSVVYFVQLVVVVAATEQTELVVAADLLAVGQSQFFVYFVGEQDFVVVELFVQVGPAVVE